uniref:Uncharacterized protein n=1 Tax=Denticeps clupeoides TaxID=299321 RepID=A0AAY4CQ26_9TELE
MRGVSGASAQRNAALISRQRRLKSLPLRLTSPRWSSGAGCCWPTAPSTPSPSRSDCWWSCRLRSTAPPSRAGARSSARASGGPTTAPGPPRRSWSSASGAPPPPASSPRSRGSSRLCTGRRRGGGACSTCTAATTSTRRPGGTIAVELRACYKCIITVPFALSLGSTLFSSFLTLLLSVCVLCLSAGASVTLSLGLRSWCDTVTDRNARLYSCAESQAIPLYLDVETSSFYSELTCAQISLWCVTVLWLAHAILSFLRLYHSHSRQISSPCLSREKELLLGQAYCTCSHPHVGHELPNSQHTSTVFI